MNLNDLTIGEAKQLASMFGGQPAQPAMIQGNRRAVIVRSRDAGVQCGELVEYATDGSTVTLVNARQMWRWRAKKGGTLLDCAQYGVEKNDSKFSERCNRIIVINACAIIDCTDEAVESFKAVSWS